MIWKKERIGDHCEITSSKRIFYSEYVDSGVLFFRSKEIIEKSIGQPISDPLYISSEKYKAIKGRYGVPVAGDMLLTSVGTIGIPYIVQPDDRFYFKDGNLTWFRNFDASLLSRFLYYWIGSKEGSGILNNTAIGSSQKALTIIALKQIECPIPPIDVQKRIVDILSAYDDLIANNQKQIKLLEEAAQRLYKEWFVDLRFPGYETTPIVDGVPEGWERNRADSFFEITIGKTPPRSEKQWFVNGNQGIPWVSISDMGNSGVFILNTNEALTKDAITKYSVKIVPQGTVLVSFKLTVGRISITTTDMCTNEAIAHFRVNDSICSYVYYYLKNFEYDRLGNTSAISQAVNSKIVKSMPFVIPDNRTLASFSTAVSPFLNDIYMKEKQIMFLRDARDCLLPKLMSGEII